MEFLGNGVKNWLRNRGAFPPICIAENEGELFSALEKIA